jgi:hypothetical protein
VGAESGDRCREITTSYRKNAALSGQRPRVESCRPRHSKQRLYLHFPKPTRVQKHTNLHPLCPHGSLPRVPFPGFCYALLDGISETDAPLRVEENISDGEAPVFGMTLIGHRRVDSPSVVSYM